MGYEDVDYCLRVFDAGLECVYEPAAWALHHESALRGRLDAKNAAWLQGAPRNGTAQAGRTRPFPLLPRPHRMSDLPRTLFVGRRSTAVTWYRCVLPAEFLGADWIAVDDAGSALARKSGTPGVEFDPAPGLPPTTSWSSTSRGAGAGCPSSARCRPRGRRSSSRSTITCTASARSATTSSATRSARTCCASTSRRCAPATPSSAPRPGSAAATARSTPRPTSAATAWTWAGTR